MMLNPKLVIVFFGETSSGKTSLINALISTILNNDKRLLPTHPKENTVYFKIIKNAQPNINSKQNMKLTIPVENYE